MEFDIATSFDALSRQVTELNAQVEALSDRVTTNMLIMGVLLILIALKLFLDHRRLAANQVNLSRNLEELKGVPGEDQ